MPQPLDAGPPPRAAFALAVLFAINTMNFFDRQIIGVLAEPIRKDWALDDRAVGWLGTAFTLLYAVVGVPFGRLADGARRTYLLAAGIFLWSLLTAASGLARNFWQLFALRLGVGVGEATCAPASSSLIGDLFPAARRARALGIFMLGLPIGIALSYAVSSRIAYAYGWRTAFFVAGIPGLLCALAALFLREPQRGAAELHNIGGRKREGSPYRLVLSIPTIWWLILSGALHNFNMYALGTFLSPLLMRYHGLNIREAGDVSMVIYGLSGIPGLFLGGIIADAIVKRWPSGRLAAGAVASLASVPLLFLALGRPRGETVGFLVLMTLGCALMYFYYAAVYSSIQDVIEPSLRGTAMALYFFAMYVLGASLGPFGTGWASDFFTARAALAAGITEASRQALEPFRAEGLRSAMYLIPLLGVGLSLVLLAGSRTVAGDMQKLQRWMRETAAE